MYQMTSGNDKCGPDHNGVTFYVTFHYVFGAQLGAGLVMKQQSLYNIYRKINTLFGWFSPVATF